jgi:hypothetical protein
METKPRIKIYRDNQLDRAATYGPVVKRNVANLLNKIDYYIVNNKWPSGDIELT